MRRAQAWVRAVRTLSVMSAPWQNRRPEANILNSQSDSLRKTLPGSAPMPCSANCSSMRSLNVAYLTTRGVRREVGVLAPDPRKRRAEEGLGALSCGCGPGIQDAGVGGAAPQVDKDVEDQADHGEDFILVSRKRESRSGSRHCGGGRARRRRPVSAARRHRRMARGTPPGICFGAGATPTGSAPESNSPSSGSCTGRGSRGVSAGACAPLRQAEHTSRSSNSSSTGMIGRRPRAFGDGGALGSREWDAGVAVVAVPSGSRTPRKRHQRAPPATTARPQQHARTGARRGDRDGAAH